MSDAFAHLQAAKIIGPREPVAVTLDATSRPIDLSALAIQGLASSKGGTVNVLLYADVDWYIRLSSVNSLTINEATVDAVGTISMNSAACVKVAAGQTITFQIDRGTDNYLYVKGSAAGTMRGWFTSEVKGASA